MTTIEFYSERSRELLKEQYEKAKKDWEADQDSKSMPCLDYPRCHGQLRRIPGLSRPIRGGHNVPYACDVCGERVIKREEDGTS